jgi:hypothetical protein
MLFHAPVCIEQSHKQCYLTCNLSGADDGSDSECSDSVVPNIIESNILNHLGPYEGINIGSVFCT